MTIQNLMLNGITVSTLDGLSLNHIYKNILQSCGWRHKKGSGLVSWLYICPDGSPGLTDNEVMIYLKRLLTHRNVLSSPTLAYNAEEEEEEEEEEENDAAVDSTIASAHKARAENEQTKVMDYIREHYVMDTEFEVLDIKKGLLQIHENVISRALKVFTNEHILSERIKGRHTFYCLYDNQWAGEVLSL
jgi:hypothetical protein